MRSWIRIAALAAAVLHAGCARTWWRAEWMAPAAAPGRADAEVPFLKLHLQDGGVIVLDSWTVDADAQAISGTGIHYDDRRTLVARGTFAAAFADIVLVETNRPETVRHARVALMGIVAGASLALTAACLANPKACFGSCPTFYVPGDEAGGPVAEGFSASIARAFEATDVDALELPPSAAATLQLEMRNEALETHLVRSVRLLVVPRPRGGRVYRAGDTFRPSRSQAPPRACVAREGDCLAAVAGADGVEWRSVAGESDLTSRETVEVVFPRPPAASGELGLVVRARNTLLNTFVFYQGLAWLGTRAGDAFAALEREGAAPPAFSEWARLLGRAEVRVLTQRGWVRAGEFGEVGPLARETQVVPLPGDVMEGDVRVRLELTRGNWRIDALALAEIGSPVAATPVEVQEVLRRGAVDEPARGRLADPGTYLVTSPGDAYVLRFALPAGAENAELFLESRGYYIEWVREQWLAEEDPRLARALLADPRGTLRRLAPAYKRIEPDIERIFWSSRVRGTP